MFFIQLPVFSLAQAVYPDVFADLCACLTKDVYEKFESVYVSGSWAKGMIMTLSGTFTYLEQAEAPVTIEGTAWFEEASLYVAPGLPECGGERRDRNRREIHVWKGEQMIKDTKRI